MDLARFGERERVALEWADAIAYDSERAGDELWARLHKTFSEAELVDLGCAIGFELGQQHWRRTVGLSARD
jgi:alkylhydroperoxidase family enzyme